MTATPLSLVELAQHIGSVGPTGVVVDGKRMPFARYVYNLLDIHIQAKTEALQAEVERLRKEREWLPIETLTEDHGVVLLYVPDWMDEFAIGCISDSDKSICCESGNQYFEPEEEDHYPTHYQLLPTPPTAAESEATSD